MKTTLRQILAFSAKLAASLALFSFGVSSARAAEMTKITIAALPTASDANVYYAADGGFFAKTGLDVEIRAMSNGPSILAALVSGDLDVGAINVVSLTAAREHGIAARFVASGGVSTPDSLANRLFVEPDSTIHGGADLNGKTIAVTALGTLADVSVKAWVDSHGGDSKTIKFLEAPVAEMTAMLHQHRADAATLAEPFATIAGKDVRSLGTLYNAIAPRILVLGWCATDSWLASNGSTAMKFVTAIAQASAWANTHPAESAKILAKYTKVDLALTTAMPRYTYATAVTPEIISPVVAAAVRYGVLPKPLPATELIWAGGR